jgi:TRAP-type C4-dicarboxylate transport system permease small subunit
MFGLSRNRFRDGFAGILEKLVLVLVVALATVVIMGVFFRKIGIALVWYDEVASILLAWLTFYGSVLAALRQEHIGFSKILDGVGQKARRCLIVFGKTAVIGFFVLVAWSGWTVFGVLGGETLVSLPWMPQRLTQSVIPIGAVLFIVAELTVLPDLWHDRDREEV